MKTQIIQLFYLKRAKVNAYGLVPIYHRITINGQRFDRSTSEYILPSKWSSESCRIKGHSDEARTINSHLDSMVHQIIQVEEKLYKKDIIICIENLKAELQGKTEAQRMLVPIFQDHNNKIEKLLNKEYAAGTGKNGQIDHLIPVQIDHLFRLKLTTQFRSKLTTQF